MSTASLPQTAPKPPRPRLPQPELFTWEMLWPSIQRSLVMLNPLRMARNPVMFVTELGAILTTLITAEACLRGSPDGGYFSVLTVLLWLTVLLANMAEAVAEARGRAQAASLRAARQDVTALKVSEIPGRVVDELPASMLKVGDVVVVRPGEIIPADGEVLQGIALVDESAVTGESAPVIRESGGDRSAVTGGTRVISDHLFVRVTARPGESFLDRMIAMVEGAERKKTPNEIALTIVLAGFTFVFLLVTVTLYPIAQYYGIAIDVPTLVALLVCLIPTTIGALLAAIGIAGIAGSVKRT